MIKRCWLFVWAALVGCGGPAAVEPSREPDVLVLAQDSTVEVTAPEVESAPDAGPTEDLAPDVCPVGASCDDGDLCTEDDRCRAEGCRGVPRVCADDGDPCTAESCDSGQCLHSQAPLLCDDADVCTTADRCQAGVCAGLAQPPGSACDDGDACTESDACSALGCRGVVRSCDDGSVCTVDSCDAETGCSFKRLEDGAVCVPGQPCRAVSVCQAGACEGGTPLPLGTECSDGDACITGATCNGAFDCVGGAIATCDDGNPCTADGCSAATGCVWVPTGAGASCVGPCGLTGTCQAGGCAGPDPCAGFGGLCSVSTCGASGHCEVGGDAPDGTPCGSYCNPAACQAGSCALGEPVDCWDGNPCVLRGCAPTGCFKLTAVPGHCNADDDPCTLLDFCAQGNCIPAADCDDDESCTLDACGGPVGCSHVWSESCPREADCHDGGDDDEDGAADCLDRACERTDAACRAAHPVPWAVLGPDVGFGHSVSPGIVWESGEDGVVLSVATTAGESYALASVCCVDASSTPLALLVTFEERTTLPNQGDDCLALPETLVSRTVNLEAPLTGASGPPMHVVHGSYTALPLDGCGQEWRPRAVVVDRLSLDAAPTTSLRLRFQLRLDGEGVVGAWELRNVVVQGAAAAP